MSQTIELHPHHLDISRDLDETIRLYKEAGFWDTTLDVGKGLLYGGSKNPWINAASFGLGLLSMATPLGPGKLIGQAAMRVLPRVAGRLATRGATRLAANTAVRTTGKAVASGAGKAVASGAGKTVGRALPSTENWRLAWNEAAKAGNGLVVIPPSAAKNVARTASQTAKSPGWMSGAMTSAKNMASSASQAVKGTMGQAGKTLSQYSARAGQPISEWTNKQLVGEFGKSLVGMSNNNKLNWATFLGAGGLGYATGHDEIFQARAAIPWTIQGLGRIGNIPRGFRKGVNSQMLRMNNPEFGAYAQKWRSQGQLMPKNRGWFGRGSRPTATNRPALSTSSAPTASSMSPAPSRTGRSWRDQYAYFNPTMQGYQGYQSNVNFNPAMQWVR